MPSSDNRDHRVVVLGSGFGGLFATKALRRAPVEITLISKENHHLFQPLLYQVATGILAPGEIAPATREILRRQRNVTVLLGEVVDIDVESRSVTSTSHGQETVTYYDDLIVSAGARQSYFGHDEFEPYAPGIKTIDDALEIRARLLGAFEMAELQSDPAATREWLTFVVVGAGATGVELAGQIRELAHRAMRDDFRRIDPRSARVVLVDAGEQVLPAYGPGQARHAKAALERLGIEIRLRTRVTDVNAGYVELTGPDGEVEQIAARFKFWAAGVTASPLGALIAAQTEAELDYAGRLKVERNLTVPGHPEIFVIGDMAAFNNLPGVAQVAMQGGRFVARTIMDRLAGRTPAAEFKYFDKGSMAIISRFRAICNIGKLELRGFVAWLMWLFVHLMYLVGFQNRVSTLGRWFIAFIGRNRVERTITDRQANGGFNLD